MDQQPFLDSPRKHRSSETTSASPARRRGVRWLSASVSVLVVVVAIHHRANKKASAANKVVPEGPVIVTPATARTGNIGKYLEAIGTVTPLQTDSITSQVTGVITAVHYHEGQLVHEGDPLIDIDTQLYAAQVAEVRGALERDENLLAEARMDLERYRQAWERKGISRQQFEDQEKIVLQAQGTVKNDEGAVQFAEAQLNYCHITAPISGRVGLRLVDSGNLVTANATNSLLVIAQLHPITVIFTLAEDDLSDVLDQIRQRRRLTVRAYDRAQQKLLSIGNLVAIDNQIDTTTGTVKLRAEFENQDNGLFPNQFVNTRLLVTTLRNQVLVPSSAIQHNGDVDFVYLVQNDEVIARSVNVGVSDEGETAVQGLQPGDVVANSSFEKLQNGSRVVICKTVLPTTSPDSNERDVR